MKWFFVLCDCDINLSLTASLTVLEMQLKDMLISQSHNSEIFLDKMILLSILLT